jgi:arylformamidase
MARRASVLHDISIAVRTGTPEWPGDVPFHCGWTSRLADGASVNLSHLTSSPHVGTHADAPIHVRDGWPATESLPLEAFLGEALVLDVSASGPGLLNLSPDDARLSGVERLLLRTGCSIATGTFPGDWPALSASTAASLCARGLVLLGVDAPSVDERESTTLDVHHALFGGGAFVLENLDLAGIPEGRYQLIALPQRLVGLDAAPVRAVLRTLLSRARADRP